MIESIALHADNTLKMEEDDHVSNDQPPPAQGSPREERRYQGPPRGIRQKMPPSQPSSKQAPRYPRFQHSTRDVKDYQPVNPSLEGASSFSPSAPPTTTNTNVDLSQLAASKQGTRVRTYSDHNSADPHASVDACNLCFSHPHLYTIGECNHPICHTCGLRLRSLCNNFSCPVCRADLKTVIVSEKLVRFEEIDTKSLTLFDSKLGVYYTSPRCQEESKKLFEFPCPICRQKLHSVNQLKHHVRSAHRAQYCDLCFEHMKLYPFEQKVFTPVEFGIHCDKGDDFNRKGHPMCHFCKIRCFDNDHLYEHLRERHEKCQICANMGKKDQYYMDYTELEEHYRADHFVCDDPECVEARTFAFPTEIDLKAHKAEVHLKGVPRSKAKQTRRLDVQLIYADSVDTRRQEQRRQQSARRGLPRDHHRDSTRDLPQARPVVPPPAEVLPEPSPAPTYASDFPPPASLPSSTLPTSSSLSIYERGANNHNQNNNSGNKSTGLDARPQRTKRDKAEEKKKKHGDDLPPRNPAPFATLPQTQTMTPTDDFSALNFNPAPSLVPVVSSAPFTGSDFPTLSTNQATKTATPLNFGAPRPEDFPTLGGAPSGPALRKEASRGPPPGFGGSQPAPPIKRPPPGFSSNAAPPLHDSMQGLSVSNQGALIQKLKGILGPEFPAFLSLHAALIQGKEGVSSFYDKCASLFASSWGGVGEEVGLLVPPHLKVEYGQIHAEKKPSLFASRQKKPNPERALPKCSTCGASLPAADMPYHMQTHSAIESQFPPLPSAPPSSSNDSKKKKKGKNAWKPLN